MRMRGIGEGEVVEIIQVLRMAIANGHPFCRHVANMFFINCIFRILMWHALLVVSEQLVQLKLAQEVKEGAQDYNGVSPRFVADIDMG